MTLEACTTLLGPSGPNILWGSFRWYLLAGRHFPPLFPSPRPTCTLGFGMHLGMKVALGREFQVRKLEIP